jgi:hypothetical protein
MRRTIATVLCTCVVSLCGLNTSRASDYAASVVDVVVARPAGFVATVVGSAFFVVALPFAAAANGVKETGDALVVAPAQFTFTRPVGDFKSFKGDALDMSNSESERGSAWRQARNSGWPPEKAARRKGANRRKPSLV